MGAIYERMKGTIQTLAEAGSDNLKVAFGDPDGDSILIPGLGPYPRGNSWAEDHDEEQGMVELILKAVEYEINLVGSTGGLFLGEVATNATGVSPTVNQGPFTALKNESEKTLTISLTTSYADADWLLWGFFQGVDSRLVVEQTLVGGATFFFVDSDGARWTVNNRVAVFGALGTL